MTSLAVASIHASYSYGFWSSSVPVSLSSEFHCYVIFISDFPLPRTNGVLMVCLAFVSNMGQVHKSYYLSRMPPSIKERKVRKPLMSWQRLETTGDGNLMTFADAHGEVDPLISLKFSFVSRKLTRRGTPEKLAALQLAGITLESA